MRCHRIVFLLIVVAAASTIFSGIADAQTPAQDTQAPAPKATTARAAQVQANLAQLMRGILLPNSNVIFFAQSNNPAEVKAAPDPSSATDPLASTYGAGPPSRIVRWRCPKLHACLPFLDAYVQMGGSSRYRILIGTSLFRHSVPPGSQPIRPRKPRIRTKCSMQRTSLPPHAPIAITATAKNREVLRTDVCDESAGLSKCGNSPGTYSGCVDSRGIRLTRTPQQ